ncbi:MAG: TIR domain-containing protein [Polyangiales bacterium]
MALLTRSELLRDLPRGEERVKIAAARAVLLVEATSAPADATFDIFLSHSSKYPREVRAIKRYLERLGFTVYVDWIEDEELDRSAVTPATADRLRHRITSSRSLLVHATEGAVMSRWVPWELGFADGLGCSVGILPILAESRHTSIYKGVEYMGLYPYVDFAQAAGTDVTQAWVNRSSKTYVSFNAWLEGTQPFRRT